MADPVVAPAVAPVVAPAVVPSRSRTTRTFITKASDRVRDAITAVQGQAAPVVAPVVAATSEAPKTEAPKTEVPKTEVARTEAPKTEAPKTEVPKQDGISASEAAKRLADLSRTERHVVKQKEELRQAREELEREKAQNATGLQRIKLIEQLRTLPKGQRLAAIQQITGWRPSDLMEDVLGDAVKTPEQISAEKNQAADQRLAELNRKIEESDANARKLREADQIKSFIEQRIAPIVTKKDFPFLCDALGENVTQQMYQALNAEYKKTGQAPDIRRAAEQAEAWYRKDTERKSKLLGLSVTSPQIANQEAQGGTAQKPTTQSPLSLRTLLQPAKTFKAVPRGKR
jgi:hypothetical protein